MMKANSEFVFPGQFQSTSHHDFNGMKPGDPCMTNSLPSSPDFAKSTAYFNPIEKNYYV